MTALDNLNMRLDYRGGNQLNRMIADKVRSLKKALVYSYQSGTAVLPDGRKFRALFNPSNLKGDYDTKMLSIPYKDVCLNKDTDHEIHLKTSEGIEPTDVKNGDVIVWEETNTHWLIYLESIQEVAYFRSDIRRCDQWIEVNGNKYWVYVRGPVETTVETGQKATLSWTGLNYSLVMYITRNEETDNYFHRFQKIKVGNVENNWEGGEHFKTWEVQVVNPYYGDGIIEVFLDEYYENEIEEARQEEIDSHPQPPHGEIYIDGNDSIDIYKSATYTIKGLEETEGGTWSVNNDKAILSESTDSSTIVTIKSGRAFTFTLTYTIGEDKYEKEIKVNSF